MKIAFFDTRSYDRASFTKANQGGADGSHPYNYEIDSYVDLQFNFTEFCIILAILLFKIIQ